MKRLETQLAHALGTTLKNPNTFIVFSNSGLRAPFNIFSCVKVGSLTGEISFIKYRHETDYFSPIPSCSAKFNSSAGSQAPLKDILGLPGGSSVKNPPCQCRERGYDPWAGKIPHTARQPSPSATATDTHMPKARAAQQEQPPRTRSPHHNEE